MVVVLGRYLGRTWDAFDFFTVLLNVTGIAKTFKVSKADVSWVRPPKSIDETRADSGDRESYVLTVLNDRR